MTLDIVVNGRLHTVVVERAGREPHRYRVTWEGRARLVDARHIDRSILSLILLDEGGASHEVRCVEAARGDLTLHLREGTVVASVNGTRARRRPGAESPGASGTQRIVAPMPGKVVRVLVEPGDEVAVRQGLIVVEAMKMENELTSPKAGRVREVAVETGMSVEAGRLLVVVE